MAASSGDDVPTQLAALLGRGTVQIRMTNETPPRISIIDVATAITGKTHHDAAQDYRRLLNQYPEVGTNCSNLKFPGRGQRDTPVVDVRGIVEIVMFLPGRHAARVHRQAAELLCRYLGGDLPFYLKIPKEIVIWFLRSSSRPPFYLKNPNEIAL